VDFGTARVIHRKGYSLIIGVTKKGPAAIC